MTPPDERLLNLVDRHFDEALSVVEASELNERLAASPAARDFFWRAARIHARLRQWGEQTFGQMADHDTISPRATDPGCGKNSPTTAFSRIWPLALAVLLLMGIGAAYWLSAKSELANAIEAARLTKTDHVRWLSEVPNPDRPLLVGQRLELASGNAEVSYQNGAIVRLQGPAIFQIESASSGFLTAGQAWVRADTPQSQGFVIRTPSAKIIDRGTEFLTRATLDGHNLIAVTSGAVDVEVPGRPSHQHVISGNVLGVELGDVPILANMERGDETAAFRFATIEPPSNRDFADASAGHARISVKGPLRAGSGPAEVLLDGRGQSGADVPRDSVFFQNGMEGLLLLDLGEPVSVSKVNSYTWHQNAHFPEIRVRAVQKYTLWGFAGDVLPPERQSLADAGWTRIARVNSDDFFQVTNPDDRPAQQACSIAAVQGSLGRFRYLLFDVQPTPLPQGYHDLPNHTFYGEIDVYVDSPE